MFANDFLPSSKLLVEKSGLVYTFYVESEAMMIFNRL